MELLTNYLSAAEDRILHRLIDYATSHGYVKYTSTLIDSWRASVATVTSSFGQALQELRGIPPLDSEDESGHNPISSLAVEMATLHRARGVSITQFLGLLKYFRRSYIEEVLQLDGPQREEYINWVNQFFDRMELALCNEWVAKSKSEIVGELQLENKRLTTEKNLYLTLMESLKEPVFWVDEEMKIRYANLAASVMLEKEGLIAEKGNRKDLADTVFPWLQKELGLLLEKPQGSYEVTLPLNQQGEDFIYSVRVTPMLDVSGRFSGVAVIAEDVTRDYESRVAINESEYRLRSFFESSNDGIAIHEMEYDDEGQPVDYTIIEANRAFTDHTGIPFDKVVGRKATEIYKQNPPPFLDRYAAVAQNAEPIRFEIYYEPYGRHYLIKAFSPGPGRFATIFSDISKRKHTEHRLRQAVEITNSIMRAAPSAVGMVHSLGKREFGWVNDRMCTMTGFSRQELIGYSARILYQDQDEFIRTGSEFVSQLQANDVGSVETIWVRKSGEPMHIQLNYAPIDPDDYSLGIVFLGHDISEKKGFEEEQLRLENQLQRTQKLESLGVLAGGIAHDFNNILVSILVNADLALSELSPHSTARPYLQDVEKASRRAGDLCRQLLAYSGKGRFVVEKLHLQDVIEEMTNMLQVSIAKNAVLKYRFADRVPPVEADATQLRQVIMNLVINASEAIESRSGVISISTGAIDCSEEYLQTTFINQNLAPGVYSYVEVTDTGIGMDQEAQEKLFEPFFTTKFSGRGLGMSAVLGIVRGHKGAIKVYSEYNAGTTIKILIPSVLEDLEAQDDKELKALASWKGKGTILLVDDEETVLTIAKKFLERFGFGVITAEDGRTAVELYRQKKDEISAVLMDLTMPRLDGEGAFSQMKVINPDVRVLLSSGYNEQEVSERFSGKGTAGFIQKPYCMAELREALKELLG